MTNPREVAVPERDVCGDDCYNVTRRDLGALVVGAGAVALAPLTAEAALSVTETDVTIKTPDGDCDAVLIHPTSGAHPGVLVWPDIGGLRPVFRDMGKRLAAEGYTVLVPNPFYRSAKADASATASREDRGKMREALFAEGAPEKDAAAFVAFLDQQKATKTSAKLATTGYCMGGPLTMRTAAAQAGRIAAAASFHGGGLATDQPNSPHLLVPNMKAKYLICVAENDDQRDPEAKNKLRAAFEAAKNPADIEVYAGANHGWCVPGSQVYNEAQAEKAWAKLLALLKSTLS
ncbi:MAG: dienelactone hydrolase family protein [Rhodospirillaceae bacterium]|nr:dienelactone hydrolase family protein [Rhodospirillaceae bacterium]